MAVSVEAAAAVPGKRAKRYSREEGSIVALAAPFEGAAAAALALIPFEVALLLAKAELLPPSPLPLLIDAVRDRRDQMAISRKPEIETG